MRLLSGVLLLSSLVAAQERVATGNLPVQRVVLYKNGIGYFEHVGTVRDTQDIPISFTSGQLNDVLKSLTVLDLNGGRIAGVTYGSSAPLDRQLGELRLPVGDKPSLAEFLGALRGAQLEVRSGTVTITGRLLGVERKTRMNAGATLEVDYLSLVTTAGEVRTAELAPGFSVRLADRDLNMRVARYLDLSAVPRDGGMRKIVISASGAGERKLFVSYISEVPIWKATYRIVLDSKPGSKLLLQGWAIVDNVVGQDWKDVQLSLVAGAPQSFIQNLSQPYYSRRPTVDLPESALSTPQTYEATLSGNGARLMGRVVDPTGAGVPGAQIRVLDSGGVVVSQGRSNQSGIYTIDGLSPGQFRVEVDAPGFRRTVMAGVNLADRANVIDARLDVGSVAESVEVTASAPSAQTSSSAVTSRGRRSGRPRDGDGAPQSTGGTAFDVNDRLAGPETTGRELGDLFEYRVQAPITIRQNQSALVPIVNSPVTVEKVTTWSGRPGDRPRRALWFTNTSGTTIDGGTFSLIDQQAFAGEGIFEPIRPDERRLISYATDLALTASLQPAVNPQRVTRMRVTKGVLIHSSELRESRTYTFRNQDTTPRTVIVEHPVRPGYQLRGSLRPVETTSTLMRFRVELKPRETVGVEVLEVKPIETTYQVHDLNNTLVASFVQARTITPAVEKALKEILARKDAISALNDKKDTLDTERHKIFEDQQRIRENMKSLKGTPEEKALIQRYTRQLDLQENRLEAIAKEAEQLEAQLDSAEAELDKAIEALSFDEPV